MEMEQRETVREIDVKVAVGVVVVRVRKQSVVN